jgi:hypothetical protein
MTSSPTLPPLPHRIGDGPPTSLFIRFHLCPLTLLQIHFMRTFTDLKCLTPAIGLLISLCVGCDSKFGNVSGKVMLDGKPLNGVAVRFEDEGGSATIARTNESGEYVLRYSLDEDGAPVGKHKVTIFTPAPVVEGTGDQAPPEIVPERYNTKSTLTREVASGSQVIDFELTTTGP